MAMTAGILGIASIPLLCVFGAGVLTGLIAAVLGLVAMGKTGDPPLAKGKGMAITGVALGVTTLALGLLSVLLLLPALSAARETAKQIQSSTQVRGIQQGMVIYSHSNRYGSGDGWYPGIDPQGEVVDVSTENRFAVLLDAGAFMPEFLINPADVTKTPFDGSTNFSSDHYSYSLLDVSEDGGRRQEWRETINSWAAVVTDRNTTTGPGGPTSVWDDSSWRGVVVNNDNSAKIQSSHILDESRYGSTTNQADDLFNATGTDDALMVYEGD